MKIGVITYKKYDENVLLDKNFSIDDLFKIILTDQDFKQFEIFNECGELLASTSLSNVRENEMLWIHPVIVKRKEEIIGTTYDAYSTPSTKHKTKITWTVKGGDCRTKKNAQKYADSLNRKLTAKIENLITR